MQAVPVGSEELCAMMMPYYGAVIDIFTPARCMSPRDVEDSIRH